MINSWSPIRLMKMKRGTSTSSLFLRLIHRTPVRAVLLIFLVTFGPAIVFAMGRQPDKTNGAYSITVGGVCSGRGNGVVGANRVHLHAKVRDDSGSTGQLIASNMILEGDHFQGSGAIFGRSATFFGRLDGYDQDSHFRGARILCSFTDSSGRTGRIVGTMK